MQTQIDTLIKLVKDAHKTTAGMAPAWRHPVNQKSSWYPWQHKMIMIPTLLLS